MNETPSMVSQVEKYLASRRRMGFELDIAGRQLLAFARYADDGGHRGPITTDLTLRWAQSSRNPIRLTWARRLEVLRPFAKYCLQFDLATEIVPRRFFGPPHRRLTPHIYYEHEIAALLEATDSLLPVGGLRPLTYRTLFGLIAATGLRISEALGLKSQDVDLGSSVIAVRETKFRKSRLVPLHSTTAAALRYYVETRQHKIGRRGLETFFVSDRGTPLADRTVHWTFEKLRRSLNWTVRGGHPAPRIHDLRHSFICHCLLRAYQQDQSVDRIVDALSTYVGHAKVSDTYWYVSATPELLAMAAQRFSALAEGGAR